MLRPGEARRRMERTLNAAYGDGLLSERTLVARLDLLMRNELIDSAGLVGDLTLRSPRRSGPAPWERIVTALRRAAAVAGVTATPAEPPSLLALDWSGGREELIVGRHYDCDVVINHPSVSRRHLRLTFRDERWILRDLDSTNGTRLNGKPVVRCRLEPGDRLRLGSAELLVD